MPVIVDLEQLECFLRRGLFSSVYTLHLDAKSGMCQTSIDVSAVAVDAQDIRGKVIRHVIVEITPVPALANCPVVWRSKGTDHAGCHASVVRSCRERNQICVCKLK